MKVKCHPAKHYSNGTIGERCYRRGYSKLLREWKLQRLRVFLNSRLYVQAKRAGPSSIGMSNSVFNDYDVESCEFTKQSDGRHYHPLNLLRIRLLGHMLSCMLDQEDTEARAIHELSFDGSPFCAIKQQGLLYNNTLHSN